MSDPDRAAEFASSTSLFVPVDWVPITPGDPLDKPLRAIRCSTGGNVDAKMAGSGGQVRTLAFADGETRWGIFTTVEDTTSASGLEGAV